MLESDVAYLPARYDAKTEQLPNGTLFSREHIQQFMRSSSVFDYDGLIADTFGRGVVEKQKNNFDHHASSVVTSEYLSERLR